jgi:hypothetical protein
MKLFLKMKAWQLFVLLFGTQFLTMAGSTVSVVGGSPRSMFAMMSGATLFFGAILMMWLWSVAIHTNRWVPRSIRPSPGRFRMALIYLSVYLAVFMALCIPVFIDKPSVSLFALIVPFHIFAMLCMVYACYFAAKNLVMAEKKENPGFYDCAGAFFLIWIYPIGVWVLQPKINRMFEELEHSQQD